jgi:hypothetical protein
VTNNVENRLEQRVSVDSLSPICEVSYNVALLQRVLKRERNLRSQP